MLDRIFNMENPFWTFLNKLADIVILEFLWLLTSIPLITIGASSCALWHCVLRLIRDEEGRITSNYFRAFRESLRTGTAVWAVHLAVIAVLTADFLICRRMQSAVGVFLLGAVLVLSVFAATVSIFLYPLSGRFDFTWKKVIGNSIFLTLRHLPHALCMLLIYVVAALGSWLITYAVIILPPLAFFLNGKLILWIFDQYMEDDEEEETEEPEEPEDL